MLLLLLLILTFQSAFKRAEHRRSGEGEEVWVSERSEFPHRPSAGRGARGTGVRSASARGRRSVSLVTFFARKESDKHDHRGYENGTFAGAVSMNRFYTESQNFASNSAA